MIYRVVHRDVGTCQVTERESRVGKERRIYTHNDAKKVFVF